MSSAFRGKKLNAKDKVWSEDKKSFFLDGVEYNASNHRMKYNPEYHDNFRQRYTEDDCIYMCVMWDKEHKADIAAALGKTHGSVLGKMQMIRKKGLFEHYKKLGEMQEV